MKALKMIRFKLLPISFPSIHTHAQVYGYACISTYTIAGAHKYTAEIENLLASYMAGSVIYIFYYFYWSTLKVQRCLIVIIPLVCTVYFEQVHPLYYTFITPFPLPHCFYFDSVIFFCKVDP
jgi:hypothetical protein